jgi:hypothetical protein
MSDRVRVTLKWIKILDKLEPWFKETGEFRFRSKISSENQGGFSAETRFPEEGHYSLSDKPGWNFVTLNKVLFEGEVEDHLVVELFGEEIDTFSANDELDRYKREFSGPPDEWVGLYEPADEGSSDPENMSNWRVSYVIEKA